MNVTTKRIYFVDRRLARQKNRPWDEFDDIATAILALIRAQNILQTLFDTNAEYVKVPEYKFEKAYAAREKAMLQLIAAREAFKWQQVIDEQDQRKQAWEARRRRVRLVAKNVLADQRAFHEGTTAEQPQVPRR
jgi:hypothetical protein